MANYPIPYKFRHLSDVFTFGIYKGCTLGDVIDMCPSYIEWCLKEVTLFLLEDEVMVEISSIYPRLFNSCQFEQLRLWKLKNWMNSYEDTNSAEDKDIYNMFSVVETPTYDKYSGSWAQEEMGYSDDDIDTIFDGDPNAYWNID